MRADDPDEPAAVGLADPARPEQAIAAAAAACSNWGRWGDHDVRGTLNFLTDDKRVEGAGLVRRGVSFSLAQPFDMNGPQTGWRRRTNPVHTMLDTGLDAARGVQGFPHGFGGADDVVFMPLQCSTQWDGLGHIFDHGRAWNGRDAADVVTSEGDKVTGIETAAALIAGRAVLLDAGRTLGRDGELPDGFAITPAHLETIIAAQGVSAGRGDIVLVRTGQLARARRDGWGGYAGGPAPGLSFTCARWLHRTEIAAIATDTWGFEVRPNEFDHAFQPLHQVVIPHIGLYIGEMWDTEALAADCAADGRYDFWLTAAPIPVTGAVGAPVNPIAVKLPRSLKMPTVRNVLIVGGGAAGCAAAILFARDGATVDLIEIKPDVSALGSGITVQGNALRVLRQLGVWDEVAAAGYAFNTLGLRAPDGTLLVEMEDARTGGPDLPATVGMYRPVLARILTEAAAAAGAKLRYATTVQSVSSDADGVDVSFSDGTSSRYDLVIGADGVRSQVRSLLGIELDTRPTGMGIWRVFTSRPDSVTRTDLYYHGACYIAGYCPTADDSLYAYLVEDAQDRTRLTPAQKLDVMRELASHYHGPWDDIRAVMTDPGTINYTRFESHLLPPPWNRGRVVLIGDAVHTCPPTIAQGAAMALEDAAVLADVVLAADRLDQAAFDAFTARRYDRVKTVVEKSVQLGQWMLDGVEGNVPALMGIVMGLVSQPALERKGTMMTDRLITHLRHVDLAVPDHGKQLDFFTSTWGLTAEHAENGLTFLAAEGSPEQYVVRLRQAADKRIDLIAFGAASAADVDALAGRLAAAGVQLVSDPGPIQTPGGGYGFRFFDNEGRTVEVSSDVAVRAHRKIEEGESIPVRLSHVVINSADPEATRAFYETHLGFALSDTLIHPHMGQMMWFLRINAWHHSLAIARCPHPSLHHASFELRGIDEYMRGTGRLLRAGLEKIWGPGRHLAGNNTFSYFLDPHGNTVEYTTELEQVDEDTWHPHLYDFTQPEVADQWGTANQMNEFVARKSFNDPDRGMFVAPPV